MSASVHQLVAPPRPRVRDPRLGGLGGLGLSGLGMGGPGLSGPLPSRGGSGRAAWLLDVAALAHCRAVLLGHDDQLELHALGRRAPQLAPMDVPPPYDRFCRTHFASVRRLHPSLEWADACPAYAIALAAHAALWVSFDEAQERLLERHWDRIRGESQLGWTQARPLIAAGCSTLDRLDPLAMNR